MVLLYKAMIHSLKEIINTGTPEQPVFHIKPTPAKVPTAQDRVLMMMERRPDLKPLIDRLELDIKF